MSRFFFLILIVFIVSCNNTNRSSQENIIAQKTNVPNKKSDTIKSRFNGDSLKNSFLKAPFNYIFKDEKTIEGTSDSHVEGCEDESEYKKNIDLPNDIVINYDLNSRKATSVIFYLNHFKTNNIRIKDCKKLIEFIDFFDPNASKYLIRNFNTIFYNQLAYEKLDNYKTDVIEMAIDHSLFAARKFNKENDEPTTSQYIDCTIKFL